MNAEIRDLIEVVAQSCYPNECFGYIVRNAQGALEMVECQNIAPDPQSGALACPRDAKYALLRGSLVATYHSHPNESSEPSEQDRFACNETMLPMYIFAYPAKEWSRVIPEDTNFPLEMREFIFGIQDCYDLVREYYWRALGLKLSNYSRYDRFWDRGEDLFGQNFAKEGFVEVHDELKEHDGILMKINSAELPNHVGVYVGGNRILHHLIDRPSRQDVFAGQWSRFTHKRVRHVSLC